MYDPIPQPRARLGWKPHPLHTWNLGTVDYPQLGSGPLLVAIPSHFSINGIFFRRPSPQDPGKSLGASSRDPGIPCNLGLVDHIARAIQQWNYYQVHEPFTCSQCFNIESLTNPSGASFRDPGIPYYLGLVDHIARAIQRWNYCRVHKPFTCS